MAKNYKDIASNVVRLVGGESNVTHFEHCSTRLRFTLADPSKVDRVFFVPMVCFIVVFPLTLNVGVKTLTSGDITVGTSLLKWE